MSDQTPPVSRNKVLIEVTHFGGETSNRQNSTNRVCWIFPGERLTFGRSEERADYPIPSDPALSRLHFEVRFDGENCELLDLDSVNGTFVNGEQVTSSLLSDGCEICAGSSSFTVGIVRFPAAVSQPDSPGSTVKIDLPSVPIVGDYRTNDEFNEEATMVFGRRPSEPVAFDGSETSVNAGVAPFPNRNERRTPTGTIVSNDFSDPESGSGNTPVNSGPPRIVTLQIVPTSNAAHSQALASQMVAWIRPEQRISVGSSNYEVDWRLPMETGLSDRHFEVLFDGQTCTLKNLSESAETKLNDQAITQEQLSNGDLIQAAGVLFRVEFSY